MPSKQQVFLVRFQNGCLKHSIQQNIVGMGWSEVYGLLNRQLEWDDFKNLIRPHHKGGERSLGASAGSLWRFIRDIKKNDYIIVPTQGEFYVARAVSNDARHEVSGITTDDAYRRDVEWLNDKKALPRTYATALLVRGMKAYQTCVQFDQEMIKEVEDALHRTGPVNFTRFVADGARDAVAHSLLHAADDRQLEELVRKLAISTGARAVTQARNSGKPGDADVIAEYDINPSDDPLSTLRVAFQVKKHQGTTGDWGINQLILRMSADPSIVRGCLVTTANDISEDAKKLIRDAKDNFPITIVTQNQLIDWILSVGLDALSID